MQYTEAEADRLAADLVKEAHANDGLAPLDLDRFWEENKQATADPFGRDIPHTAMGGLWSPECIFAELGVEEDWYRLRNDPAWRAGHCKAYNDKAEPIIGIRPLPEGVPDPELHWPPIQGLHDIFEAQNVWHNDSYWLMQSADDPEELRALLDRVDERLEDLRSFMLPENWEAEKERLVARGAKVPRYRHQRGPITFATSIYGVENLVFLILDEPQLAERFSATILRAMLERARILDEEGGFSPEEAPRGFSFADDNCYLMTPEMYELFGYPILKGMFDRYAPDPEDRRFQHSDSAMGHLLPLLGKLDLTGTNFGPTVTVREIREHLPRAVIRGQLAPFTYSRNEEVQIVREFLRDHAQARDARGLVFGTAGSINNGSRLTGSRLIMAAVQRYGRFDD
jgi:uroporphyrinogen decarboxylase